MVDSNKYTMRNFIDIVEGATCTLKNGREIVVRGFESFDDNLHCYEVFAELDGEMIGSGKYDIETGQFRGIEVDPRFRRLGVATAIYNHVESLGYPVSPSPHLKPDGMGFWAARHQLKEGKQFKIGRATVIEQPSRESIVDEVSSLSYLFKSKVSEGEVIPFPKRTLGVGDRVTFSDEFFKRHPLLKGRVGTVKKLLDRNGKRIVMVAWDDGGRSGWDFKSLVVHDPRKLQEETSLTRSGSYRSKDSKLDYDGDQFDKYQIHHDGKVVGEIDVQYGKRFATVRNIIIYNPENIGKGIGKRVYQELRKIYSNREVRSSYNVNRKGEIETTGLSDDAIHMWDSLVNRGMAVRQEDGDRFFYKVNYPDPKAGGASPTSF